MGALPRPRVVGKGPFDAAVRHQVYLERLASEISGRVQRKAGRFARDVYAWLDGLDEDLRNMPSRKAMRALAATDAAQTEILVDAALELTSQLPEVAGYEAEFNARLFQASIRRVRVRAAVGKKIFERALTDPIPATGELLEDFVDGWAKREVKAANQAIAQGFSNGLTNAEIKQALRGTRAKKFRDGLAPRVGKNADAVVRTSVQHVANTARAETYDRNADIVEGYQIVATLDGHTTPKCRSLDGRVFPLGKGPMPPFHVRCRTTTIPEISKEFAFLDEGATRSSVDGPVDADETYYSWLKGQSAEFQDEVLGPERGKLFRDGGLTADEFARLNLDRNFEPLTLDEMRRLEPKAFERAGL